jgi:GT2 family glycosyltransferase
MEPDCADVREQVLMERRPRASVVVPTYGRSASVLRLLRALRQQSVGPSEFEAIVVDDGSPDDTYAVVSALDTPFVLEVVRQGNRGRAAACNAGIRRARGEIVVILDDDMEPPPGFLAAHLGEHAGGERLGVIGAVPVHTDERSSPVTRFVAEKFDRHLARLAAGGEIRFSSFYSGNFSIRRATLLDEVGVFDEEYTLYGNEDTELALRLMRAGIELRFSAGAMALQHYEKDFAGLARDSRSKGRTLVLTHWKHPEEFGVFDLRRFHAESPKWVERSPKWKLLRGALLVASRFGPAVGSLVVRGVQYLEARRGGLLGVGYLFAIDFFFWDGVASAVREGPPAGRVASGGEATAALAAGVGEGKG